MIPPVGFAYVVGVVGSLIWFVSTDGRAEVVRGRHHGDVTVHRIKREGETGFKALSRLLCKSIWWPVWVLYVLTRWGNGPVRSWLTETPEERK